jgi:putative PIN family toxin of toxin-antitoxin system
MRTVIDTNVLLDCFAFDDPRVQALWSAVEGGRLACIRSAQTDEELADVLRRPQFQALVAARASTVDAILQRWQAHADLVPRVFAAPWGCTDPHDQKFLDLAATARASLLITKDKALLKLARRARGSDLAIVRPEDALARLTTET